MIGIPEPRPDVKLRAYAAPYFALQGALTLLTWAVIFLWPPIRPHFQPPGIPELMMMGFFLPDMLLFAGASFAAAYGFARGARWRSSAAWLVTGAMGYAALYTLAILLATGTAWLPVVVFLPAALLSLLFAASADAPAPR
jgi:hypothetical protein